MILLLIYLVAFPFVWVKAVKFFAKDFDRLDDFDKRFTTNPPEPRSVEDSLLIGILALCAAFIWPVAVLGWPLAKFTQFVVGKVAK